QSSAATVSPMPWLVSAESSALSSSAEPSDCWPSAEFVSAESVPASSASPPIALKTAITTMTTISQNHQRLSSGFFCFGGFCPYPPDRFCGGWGPPGYPGEGVCCWDVHCCGLWGCCWVWGLGCCEDWGWGGNGKFWGFCGRDMALLRDDF